VVPDLVSDKPERLVVVTGQGSQPVWVIKAMENQHMVKVKTMNPPDMGPDKVCVLWLMWKDGTIASLGPLSETPGERMVKVPKGVVDRPMANAQVAVTVEKKGPDYPTMSPQTVFRGDWVTL
jgi:anti-sigma-K factor RskA